MAARAAEPSGDWAWLENQYGMSPIHAHIGLELQVKEEGRVVVRLRPSDAIMNRSGIVGGGILATMIDSAAAQSCRTLLDPEVGLVTVDLSVTYLRPARGVAALEAYGLAERVTSRLAFATARVRSGDSEDFAVGSATFAVRA